MMTNQPASDQPLRIWSLPCPFRKDGTPVLGSFGANIRSVIILDYSTWQRLCEEIPALAQRKFEVGELGE